MRVKLAKLVDYLSVPSIVVSLRDGGIMSVNAQMLRRHGTCFSEMLKVEFLDADFDQVELFLRLLKKSPAASFQACPESEAMFEMLVFKEDGLGVVYERFPGAFQGVAESGRGSVESFGEGPAPFHFSYLHNFLMESWHYSQPDLLASLNLAGTEGGRPLNWRSIIHEDDLPLYDNTIKNAREHGGNHEIQYRIKTCSGEIVGVRDYCCMTEPDGKWPVLVGSVVSAGVSHEELRKAEKQALVGRVVGGMIHDFKNLLGGIQNSLEWAVSVSDKPELRESLGRTLKYTEQAANLITSTLRFSSGRGGGRVENISFREMLGEMETLIRRILPSSIALEIAAEENLPFVCGQRELIQDMILNLCVNARDAMRQKGDKLRIEAAKSRSGEGADAQDFIRLVVSDNGCGMSKSELKTLFDAFYSTKENGVGLGLWMVRETVRAFDGRIDVSSEAGRGTVFEITFPVMERDESGVISAEPRAEAASASPGAWSGGAKFLEGRTVLYIEDDALIRGCVAGWLESMGARLHVAADGVTGSELFAAYRDEISLILQDFILPGRRGDELLAEFKAARPDVPVVIMSADMEGENAEIFLGKGASATLRKPFKMDELMDLLSKICR